MGVKTREDLSSCRSQIGKYGGLGRKKEKNRRKKGRKEEGRSRSRSRSRSFTVPHINLPSIIFPFLSYYWPGTGFGSTSIVPYGAVVDHERTN